IFPEILSTIAELADLGGFRLFFAPRRQWATLFTARTNSPSVKGWPRSGRGSSAFGALSLLTLNYPGAPRHPFTAGELVFACQPAL
ncbi:MAG: hypothetical protein LBK71_01760, partial [Verrucomicrobiales bacterium]|nr:hypothetical protein [Verrucomicrobiales bacterium]